MNLGITPRMNNNLTQPQKVAFGGLGISKKDYKIIEQVLLEERTKPAAETKAESLVSSVPYFLKSNPTSAEQILALKNLQGFFGGIQSGEAFKGLSMKSRIEYIREAIDSKIEKLKPQIQKTETEKHNAYSPHGRIRN